MQRRIERCQTLGMRTLNNSSTYAPSLAAIRPTAEEEIPVLDIGPYLAGEAGALERVGAEMRYALENIDFYFVVNYGIRQN
jgi:hypothetical protein